MVDKSTYDKIQLLHPMIREEVYKIINECNLKLTGKAQVRITQGLRTFEEQDKLYAQGRTTEGKKVTNAKGGQSIHNYGTALDIVLIIGGKEASWDIKKDWDNDNVSDWDECVKVFAKYNWSWGGNWSSFKDFPHFEKIGYNNWRVLAKKTKGKTGYFIP